MNTDKQEAKEAKERERKRRMGTPPYFLQVLISGDFKSNDFVTADSTGFAATFFVTADSKGFARVDEGQSVGGVRRSVTE